MISQQQAARLQEAVNFGIGFAQASEEFVRFQLTRVLIRYIALVQKGEDDTSPQATMVREAAGTFVRGLQPVQVGFPAQKSR